MVACVMRCGWEEKEFVQCILHGWSYEAFGGRVIVRVKVRNGRKDTRRRMQRRGVHLDYSVL